MCPLLVSWVCGPFWGFKNLLESDDKKGEGGERSADVVKCIPLLPPLPLFRALLATLTEVYCCPGKAKPLPLFFSTVRQLDDDTVDSLNYNARENHVLPCG